MAMFFRLPFFTILFLICFAVPASAVAAADPFPRVATSYFLKIQGNTVWSHNPDKRLAPASLTKIMTALLTLEHGGLDDVVTVSRNATAETGTRIGLRAGYKMRVRDLLAAALLQSANDACHALADHVGKDEKRFVVLMNARSKELGLRDTRFSNACGHDHPRHYSSAHDLAILAETALKDPTFQRLVSLEQLDVQTVNGKRTFHLRNKNELIGRYQGVVGVKTGYTEKAGRCLIALAERDGVQVLLVLLHARNRWKNADAMLDRAFSLAAETVPGVEPEK
ncbi:MAG: D-alanyl-D-alanine carboxypeptidase [Geobacteraceae bacterium]|nr:MAG: D-alanyl-D-alanine carboxypeptidase [Geobacteraceae bacterium]